MSTPGREKNPGIVYTFYSFKGGVGRTMALANAAALLAKWGYSVLMVDWDLEAPGLARRGEAGNPRLSPKNICQGHRELRTSRKLETMTGLSD